MAHVRNAVVSIVFDTNIEWNRFHWLVMQTSLSVTRHYDTLALRQSGIVSIDPFQVLIISDFWHAGISCVIFHHVNYEIQKRIFSIKSLLIVSGHFGKGLNKGIFAEMRLGVRNNCDAYALMSRSPKRLIFDLTSTLKSQGPPFEEGVGRRHLLSFEHPGLHRGRLLFHARFLQSFCFEMRRSKQ